MQSEISVHQGIMFFLICNVAYVMKEYPTAKNSAINIAINNKCTAARRAQGKQNELMNETNKNMKWFWEKFFDGNYYIGV